MSGSDLAKKAFICSPSARWRYTSTILDVGMLCWCFCTLIEQQTYKKQRKQQIRFWVVKTSGNFQTFPEIASASTFLDLTASKRSSVTCVTTGSWQLCHASITTPHECDWLLLLKLVFSFVCLAMTVNSNVNQLLPTLAETRTNKIVTLCVNHLLSGADGSQTAGGLWYFPGKLPPALSVYLKDYSQCKGFHQCAIGSVITFLTTNFQTYHST